MRDRRWDLLDNARERLIDAFSAQGVTQVEYVAAFPHFDDVLVWLCTSTDRERDALGSEDWIDPAIDPAYPVKVAEPVARRVRSVLLDCGFTEAELSKLGTVAQSQQAVDRDYKASWFYAMR